MKKVLFFGLLTVCFVMTMASCGGGGQQQASAEEEEDSTTYAIPTDQTLYGICGEGTAMNTLQLLRDNGDTLNLSLTNAIEAGQVFGGMQVGDRMAVMANPAKTEATIVINQNALLGDWVMPNPIDGSSEVGIRIKEGGIAESIDQSSIIYKTWKIYNGRLEILSQRDGGGDEEELNLYELVKLGNDSLVYKTINKPREEMETFEYSRWKEPEKMDLHGLQLENAEDEFRLD
jgi:hypothetical protein